MLKYRANQSLKKYKYKNNQNEMLHKNSNF